MRPPRSHTRFVMAVTLTPDHAPHLASPRSVGGKNCPRRKKGGRGEVVACHSHNPESGPSEPWRDCASLRRNPAYPSDPHVRQMMAPIHDRGQFPLRSGQYRVRARGYRVRTARRLGCRPDTRSSGHGVGRGEIRLVRSELACCRGQKCSYTGLAIRFAPNL
jgi:hypothetical protein